MESQMERLYAVLGEMRHDLGSLKATGSGMEKDMDEIQDRLATLSRRLEEVHTGIAEVVAAHEKRISALEHGRDALQRDVDGFGDWNARLKALEARLARRDAETAGGLKVLNLLRAGILALAGLAGWLVATFGGRFLGCY